MGMGVVAGGWVEEGVASRPDARMHETDLRHSWPDVPAGELSRIGLGTPRAAAFPGGHASGRAFWGFVQDGPGLQLVTEGLE